MYNSRGVFDFTGRSDFQGIYKVGPHWLDLGTTPINGLINGSDFFGGNAVWMSMDLRTAENHESMSSFSKESSIRFRQQKMGHDPDG